MTATPEAAAPNPSDNRMLVRRLFGLAWRYRLHCLQVLGIQLVLLTLGIGGLSFTGLTTVFSDLHVFEIWGLMQRPSLLLGMDILGRFNAIELNYARRQVVFYLPPKGRLG